MTEDRVGWRPLWQLLKGQKTEIKPETCYMEKWLWRIPRREKQRKSCRNITKIQKKCGSPSRKSG